MSRYKLYFRKDCEDKEIPSDIETLQDAFNEIYSYLDIINYKYHKGYIRFWRNDSDLIFDFGSHVDFFIIKDITDADFAELIKEY